MRLAQSCQPAERQHLTAVHVAGQLEIGAGIGRALDAARVVREHDERQRGIAAGDGGRHVLAMTGQHARGGHVVDARELERIAHADPRVAQRLIDQNAATARAHNQPVPSRLDAVVASEPVPPQIQVGQAAVILADTTDGTGARRRSLLRVETDPVPDGAGYMMAFNILETDRDRFDRDLPALSAIYRSRHEDPERCQQVGNQRLADGAARNAAVLQGILDRGRMLNRAQNDRFDRIEATIHNQSVAGQRAAVDQAEFLSGQQKFLDTATGTVGSVGYDYSERTLQHVNDAAQDPDRFQPVHRWDEQYPQ